MMYTSHLLLLIFWGGGGQKEKKKKKTATLWDEQARTNKPGQAKDSVGTNKPGRTSPGTKKPVTYRVHHVRLASRCYLCIMINFS